MLNVARGFQGVGAAAMFATALALIAQEFEGRERANAIGIWGATVGGVGRDRAADRRRDHRAASAGSGSSSSTCRSGSRAIVLTERKLANVKATDPQPIDWAGLSTFSAALFLLIFGLIRGNAEGWGSAQIVALPGRPRSR